MCQIITNGKALCCSYKPMFRTTVCSNLQETSSIFRSQHPCSISQSLQGYCQFCTIQLNHYLATVTVIIIWTRVFYQKVHHSQKFIRNYIRDSSGVFSISFLTSENINLRAVSLFSQSVEQNAREYTRATEGARREMHEKRGCRPRFSQSRSTLSHARG